MQLAHQLGGASTAPALVLIHGITESRETWRPLFDELVATHRVLAVDLRGHGQSPDGDTYDPFSYATDVVDTVSSAGLSDVVVVGHSLGGVVASAYAAMAPTRGVINIDQPLRLSGFKAQLSMVEPMLKGDDATFQAAITMLFSMMFGQLSAAKQERVTQARRANQQVVLGTWAAVFESTEAELDATVDALAAAITTPYLALHGADPGPDYADWLRGRIPSATYELWPDSGHYPHLVDPARFLSRLAQFEAQVR